MGKNSVGFFPLVLLLGACSSGGGTTSFDGEIAPPPAHPALTGADAGPGDVAGELVAHDAGGAGDVAGEVAPPPPCLSNNAIGFAFNAACVAGGACFAHCELGGAPYIGCIDDGAGLARTCVASCAQCP